jgi:hypothetical protein
LRAVHLKIIVAASICVICALLSLFAPVKAAVLTETLDFPLPEIEYHDNSCIVRMLEMPTPANPGEPLLPVYGLRMLLPQGEEVVGVRANILRSEEIPIAAPLACGQRQVRLSQAPPVEETLPDEAIYGGEAEFPGRRAIHVTTQTWRGYNIAFLNVYPVVYEPGEDVLICATRMEVAVETAPSARMLTRSMGTLRAGVSKDAKVLSGMAPADGAADSYVAAPAVPVFGGLVDGEETYPLVIITNFFLKPLFEPLKEYKDSTGLRTAIVHVGEINSNYSGADMQEKIRNFIKDAYENWETEYVILGADREWIPARGLYATASGDTDPDIASDLYYAALDGSWNDDEDEFWGEPGEDDLIPEVSVGRLSVGDSVEVVNLVNKILKYERTPVSDQIRSGQTVGEVIAATTYGADYMNEIRDGSSAHGYTTVGLPGGFEVDSLYDRDYYPVEWDKYDLASRLNSGRHIVNHIGHCSLYSALKLDNDDVDTMFTNEGDSTSYFILYTQGCYAGSFDNRDRYGDHLYDDCIGERFTLIENGAVAFIGNSRFGYYSTGNTRGASQYFHRQFFDAVFGEGITAIGPAHDDSRVDNIPYIEYEAMRWVYYTVNLLGDPSMDIWTDVPESLSVDHPDTVYAFENEVAIEVSDGFNPVAGARVSLFAGDIFSSGFTGGDGVCVLDPLVEAPGQLYLSVTAHNFHSYIDSISIAVAGEALVTLEGFTADDDTTGVSSGNSNQEVDAGETIESQVALRNAGQDTAYNVTARISTANPYVSLIDSTGTYGDIPPDSVVSPSWSFAYSILPSCPDSEMAAFDLSVDYGDTNVIRHMEVAVHAPVLAITAISVADTLSGNGDGCIEAGEAFEVVFGLKNTGSGEARGICVTIAESDMYVLLDADSAWVDTIAVDSTAWTTPSYVVSLSPECPEFHEIGLSVTFSFESGRQAGDSTVVYVGGSLEDDFEDGEGGWTHTNVWPTYADNWHLEDYRNHTPDGTYSWKFGGPGSANYSNYAYGELVTPEICLGSNSEMTFWQWVDTEMLTQKVAWDGGIVEISTDGGESWTQIAPVGGYPHKIYGDSHCPLPANTPCFGSSGGWTQVQFNLSAYEGRVKVRFVFGSGAVATDEGWYIDDIIITDDFASVDIDPGGVTPDRFALHALSPNPVASATAVVFDVPNISRVKIEVYDVRGRVVATIADGVFQPARYRLDWGAADRLSPGVYFVAMDTPTFRQTRKAIIIR